MWKHRQARMWIKHNAQEKSIHNKNCKMGNSQKTQTVKREKTWLGLSNMKCTNIHNSKVSLSNTEEIDTVWPWTQTIANHKHKWFLLPWELWCIGRNNDQSNYSVTLYNQNWGRYWYKLNIWVKYIISLYILV